MVLAAIAKYNIGTCISVCVERVGIRVGAGTGHARAGEVQY